MSGKLTKYNLNKQKELTNNGEPHIHDTFQIHDNPIGEIRLCNECNFPVDKNRDVVIENATAKLDHPYNQRFYIQESFKPKRFLFWNYKSNIIKTVIPTGLCDVCSLPVLAHE